MEGAKRLNALLKGVQPAAGKPGRTTSHAHPVAHALYLLFLTEGEASQGPLLPTEWETVSANLSFIS